jgi:toxin-antitoxin system PIN domain toxin
MIAVDTNVLVYAHRKDLAQHRAARLCLASLSEGQETWAIPCPCLHEFLAVVTRSKVFRRPSTLDDAVAQVDAWLASPSVVLLEETREHWAFLAATLRSSRTVGGAIHDARIAALCLEHGVRELWTADRDFRRFPELSTYNPFEDDRVHESRPAYGAVLRARAAGRRRALLESA